MNYIAERHVGEPDLHVTADAATWIGFVRKEKNVVWAIMRRELAGPNPTPVEKLLVERLAACWLQVYEADILFAQRPDNCSRAQSEHMQRRMDRAHRRFLSAVKTLANVRRLAVPILVGQVNIGEQQVNLANGKSD